MFNPKIVGKKEETIERLQCGGWFYCYRDDCTEIFNESEQKIGLFYVKLTQEQVNLFKTGFENGFTSGKEYGGMEKCEEIKKLLKI